MISIKRKSALAFIKITKECDIASEAVTKLNVANHDLKVRLASIANDFCTSLKTTTTSINQVLPHLDGELQLKLKDVAENLLSASGNIQQSILDPSVLKNKIVNELQEIKKVFGCFDEFIKGDYIFLFFQLRKITDEIMCALSILNHQALCFEKDLKELTSELTNGLAKITEVYLKIKVNNAIIEDELRQLIQYIQILTSRIVHKFENWIRINKDNEEGLQVVQSFCDNLSEFQNEMHIISSSKTTTMVMIERIKAIQTFCFTETKSFITVDDFGIGSEELIRSSIFIGIGHADWFSNQLDIVLQL